VCDHYLIAELDGFSVVDDLIGLERRKGQGVAETKIAMAAAAEQWSVAFASQEFRACHFLELSQTAGVIEVRVAVQQKLYVAQVETEFRNVAFDLWRGFDKTAVEKEMPLRRGDQEGCHFGGADIVKISDDPKWRHRFVPGAAGFIGLSNSIVCRKNG
jgi:hypothetical protein